VSNRTWLSSHRQPCATQVFADPGNCKPSLPQEGLSVGASLLAMDVNGNASFLIQRSALESIASKLAPTHVIFFRIALLLSPLSQRSQCFIAGRHTQLGVDVLEVPLDGFLTEIEGLCNALVGHRLLK